MNMTSCSKKVAHQAQTGICPHDNGTAKPLRATQLSYDDFQMYLDYLKGKVYVEESMEGIRLSIDGKNVYVKLRHVPSIGVLGPTHTSVPQQKSQIKPILSRELR
jgi:hypothetical protein